MINIEKAKRIMGKNLIGPNELKKLSKFITFSTTIKPPTLRLEETDLKKIKKDYILILGVDKDNFGESITINYLHKIFGVNPELGEPCFYSQDWYIKEDFAYKETLKNKRYLIRKNIQPKTRGIIPQKIKLHKKESLPSALLTTYTFFCNYLLNKEILWKHDYIRCKNYDHNKDQIYTGRYIDPEKINKNGFSIHRHLSIRDCYGASPQINI